MPSTSDFVTEIGTQSVYTVISREDFRDGLYCALDEAVEQGKIRPFRRFIARRRLENRRAFNAVYEKALADVPVGVYGAGFDFQKFLDWLVENLPQILEILMSLAVFL